MRLDEDRVINEQQEDFGDARPHVVTEQAIQSFAMTLPRWDRIYFFVFSATIFALVGFAVVLFAPLVEVASATDNEQLQISQQTLLEAGNTRGVLFSLLPLVLAASALWVLPRNGTPDRPAKINLWFSTFLVYLFIVLSIKSVGILFIPTAILMTAAAVGAQVRRRASKVFAAVPEESKSGRGGGKRRRNKS